jgi:RNA polymerase sigma-70 factor, ECF subfamily
LAVDDLQLIALYRESGCRQSLDELMRRNLGPVRNIIYPMVLDEEAADDLTQEVFLKAFRGLAAFDGKAAFSTWLYRIAMNTTYTFLARRKRSPVHFRSDPPDSVDARLDPPEQAAMQSELDGQIARAMESLSPKLRAAIVLTTLQGVNPAEAAKIEGCSTATMYWRIHEARKQLDRQLRKWMQS